MTRAQEQERIESLLPWYLNGSLDPGERREVEDWLAEHGETAQAMLREAAFVGEAVASGLPAESLVAYAAGDPMGDDERGRIEAHLAVSPLDAQELEMVQEALRIAGADDGDSGVAPVVPLARPAERPQVSSGPWRWGAIAASFLAVIFGVSSVMMWPQFQDGEARWQQSRADLDEELDRRAAEAERLERQLADARGELDDLRRRAAEPGDDPPADAGADVDALRQRLATAEAEVSALERAPGQVVIADLFADDVVLRGAPGTAEIPPANRIQAGDDALLVLVLPAETPESFPSFTAEISTLTGDVLWSAADLRRGDGGEIVLAVRGDAVSGAGDGAVVRLYGIAADGSRTPVAAYPYAVSAANPVPE
ncbi:MAG: hypothetical protein AAGD06_25380 [Acidobacteriota bacterium]